MTECQGKCLCGEVKFSIEIEKKEAGMCHCDMCRKWSTGPLVMWHGLVAPKIENEDALGVYKSSDWGERCFCKNCGSNMFWRALDGSFYGVSVDALENAEDFKLVSEVFTDKKPLYYNSTEATQRMTSEQFWEMIKG